MRDNRAKEDIAKGYPSVAEGELQSKNGAFMPSPPCLAAVGEVSLCPPDRTCLILVVRWTRVMAKEAVGELPL